jgi:Tfp pilus assembly protein PilN
MINLLPPEVKQEMRYSRFNAILLRYVRAIAAVCILLAGALIAGRYYLNQKIETATHSLGDTQHQIDGYKQLQADTSQLTARIGSITTVQASQARFSELLTDLAEFMPQGTAINSVTLTGDDAKPVRLVVAALDYKTALSVRDSITRSKRISAADIEQVSNQPTGKANYQVTVTFVFNPGAAR